MHKLFCFSTDFLQWGLKIRVLQSCVHWRSRIFDSGSGGRQNLKNTLFSTFFFYRKYAYIFSFLNRFSSIKPQSSCIAKLRSRIFLFWIRGPSKPEKNTNCCDHKNAYTFSFLNQFFQWGLKIQVLQSCVHWGSRIFDFGSGGPSKLEK